MPNNQSKNTSEKKIDPSAPAAEFPAVCIFYLRTAGRAEGESMGD